MKTDDISSVTDSQYDFNSSGGKGEGGVLRRGRGGVAPPPLYGRDNEKRLLLETYQSVLQTQESRVVFVHGTSGQGKTSLVDTLREPVIDANGYFCAGKFFQDSQIQEPYSAITAAFSDLCDLVVQSPDFNEQSRRRIEQALALDTQVLSNVINLTPFLSQDSIEEIEAPRDDTALGLGKAANFARFRTAWKTFLLTMATEKHPIVLFLDDVQSMDDGSAKLVDMFICDQDIKNVMFVFSYRDEEASKVDGILQHSRTNGVTDIQLSNLDLSSIHSMLTSHLGSSPSGNHELSELTLQRTGGNPFFIDLFLDVIITDGFVTFDGPYPTFDVDQIRSSIMVAESLADLLSQKICRLPTKVRHILVVASLIGYSFDEKVLFEVPHIVNIDKEIASDDKSRIHKQVLSCLSHAVDVGFIEKIKAGYQFTHDKLQAAFQDLVDPDTRDNLHLLIGQTYLAQSMDGSIYSAAVHLNVAPGFTYNTDQTIQLAGINLRASHHCQRLSAFDTAVTLLSQGIHLLESVEMKWSPEVFGLSLELTEVLANMALLIGDFDTCRAATKEAMCHVDTKEIRMNLMLIEIECRMANNEMLASIKASMVALAELGVVFPKKTKTRHVAFKAIRLNFLMKGKTDDDILGLPMIEDTSISVTIRLLMLISFLALLVDDESTGVYAALHAMELTLEYGLSTYGPAALAIYSISVSIMGNIDRACSLGNLALKLLEQNPSRDADCSTMGNVYTVVLHWREPLSHFRDPLFEAATTGFEKGHLLYSTFCMSQVFCVHFTCGAHLDGIEEALHAHYTRIHDLDQEELLIWFRPSMQLFTNLRSSSGDWHQLALFSGEFMDSNYLREANVTNNAIVTTITFMQKALLANAFGGHEIARQSFEELEPFRRIMEPVYAFTQSWCWSAGFANYECFRTDGKRKYLRKARKLSRQLQKRGPNATACSVHLNLKELILRREKAKRGRASYHDETLRLMDRSLAYFSLEENPNQESYVAAAAFVDAGLFAERIGRFVEAEQYLEQGRQIYDGQWGAYAPAAWVEEKCEGVRRKQTGNVAQRHPDQELVGGIVQVHNQVDVEE